MGGLWTHVKDFLRSTPGCGCVFLAEGDDFLGEALGFFGFGPCRLDRFVLEERCHEVSEKGLSVGG